jgi:hypothetical protein
VSDGEAQFCSTVEVLLDVALWVNHNGFAAGGIADEV